MIEITFYQSIISRLQYGRSARTLGETPAEQGSARMLIANNVGHFHYREQPEEFSRNVMNFEAGWQESDKLRSR